ncbi:MAG: hypothetical protein OXF66_10335 [Gammaproteobacteria bacterium]|nr:hypothetical protein [Gammaproteobacteria bacterium]
MKGDDLPQDDRIVRYVKPSMIQEDGTADGSEFCLRPNKPDEEGLSVNWLEVFGKDKVHQLSEARRLCRLTLKSSGRFAEMNVGTVLQVVSEELDTLRIVHDPLEAQQQFDADPSHAEMRGLPLGDSDQAMLVGELIAQCVTLMHPARIAD